MAKSRNYPWNILDIDSTRDESTIKKAYAAKLKITRPEDDQAAFQELVEAKDVALSWRGSKERIKRPKKIEPKKPKVAAKKAPEKSRPAESEPGPRDLSVSIESDPDAGSSDFIVERRNAILSALQTELASSQGEPNYTNAEIAIEKLKRISIDARAQIEPELLTIVADNIQAVLHSGYKVDGEGRRIFHTKKSIILALDEEFGWSRNDRQLHFMHFSSNDSFSDQLQLLRDPKRVAKYSEQPTEMSWWQKGIGVMVLAWFGLQILSRILGYR